MSTLADCSAGWKNSGDQQYITKNYGRYQNCMDRQTDGGQGRNQRHMEEHSYTIMGSIKTKMLLLFGFPSSTEPTGVIGAMELLLYLSH